MLPTCLQQCQPTNLIQDTNSPNLMLQNKPDIFAIGVDIDESQEKEKEEEDCVEEEEVDT